MELPALDRESVKSPYAEQLSRGFAGLQFTALLEKEFREFYTLQNLPRGRLSMLIALILLLSIAGMQLLFGSLTDDEPGGPWRFVILIPLMTMLVVASHLPLAQRWYAPIATVGVMLVGLVATYICHLGAMYGAEYLFAGQALVILYACLFLGLLFNVASMVGGLLVAAHVVIGAVVGLSADQLWYGGAILGAAAVTASISTYELEHALRTNFLETRVLHELAERDGMTGLYNRRIFDNQAKRVWRQSRRDGEPLQIVFVDIDYFKVFNDLYGHQAGDDCLKKVADAIARCAKRPFDFTARYGGEEFVLMLYGSPEEYARSLPEQIRREVMNLAIAHEGSRAAKVVTVSVGVASAGAGSGRSLTGAIQVADEALYQAKQEGRNRVVFKTADDCEVETGNFRVANRRLA